MLKKIVLGLSLCVQSVVGMEDTFREDENKTQDCAICLETLFDGEQEIITLRCHKKHAFHLSCWQDYAKKNYAKKKCPLCRHTIDQSKQEKASEQQSSGPRFQPTMLPPIGSRIRSIKKPHIY